MQEWQKWRDRVSWLESLFKVNPLEQDQQGQAEAEAEGASASSWPVHPHVHWEASLPFFTFFSPGLCLSHCWKSLPYYFLLPVSNPAPLLTWLICPFGFRFNAPASMKPSLISQMWIRCPFVFPSWQSSWHTIIPINLSVLHWTKSSVGVGTYEFAGTYQ